MSGINTTPPPSSNRTCGFPASGSHASTPHHRVQPLWRVHQGLREQSLDGQNARRASVGGLASKRNCSPLTKAHLHQGPFAPRSLPASPLL